MIKEISYNEFAAEVMEQLPKGAFLTTANGGKVNTMTIGWGSIGFMWRKPVFTVMVRPSRYTYQLIEHSDSFSVSIPLKDMKNALSVCGSKSGRDLDKFTAAGLSTDPGQKIRTPVIANCGLTYECRIIFKQEMSTENLDSEIQKDSYGNGDYHILYFGEIVASYRND